jgi:protein-L-isoaspartate O-methyltransferase
MELIQGNGLEIDGTVGQCRLGLDRIYVGAAVEKRELCQLASLLKPGGILVGPGMFTEGT